MNYKLPILAVVFCLAIGVRVAAIDSSQPVENKEVKESIGESHEASAAAATNSSISGQELVAEAAHRLLLAPGLEAKTRQSVHIFDQKLVGSGEYCQLTQGPKLFLKLDLKLQVGGQVHSLRQISDGDSLWEVRGQGELQTFSHVNLGRLREVAGNTKPLVSPSFWMAIGGIPRLLAKLNESFIFGPPRPAMIGKHPVWQVEGEWKPAMLARMLPAQSEAILAGAQADLQELPEQVPHGVTLILGRDKIIPLFPYSFSYFRDVLVDKETGKTRRESIVTWELFEVRIRPGLRPSDFDFRPSDQEFQERTAQCVARLKAAAKKMTK